MRTGNVAIATPDRVNGDVDLNRSVAQSFGRWTSPMSRSWVLAQQEAQREGNRSLHF